MRCPNCGVEVVEEAGFCHKCGERLTVSEQEGFPQADQEVEAHLPIPPDETPAPEAPEPTPPPTPAGKFRESAAARQETSEEEPEEDLWQGGYSPKAMIGAWALSGIITILLLVLAIWGGKPWLWTTVIVAVLLLWLFQFLKLCFRRINIRYQLTTQRFIHETGILRRVTDRIEVIDMDDIAVEQSFPERFVGVGTIRITSSDRTHPELVMPGIEHVKEVAGRIDEIRRRERRRRGLHIESI